MTSETINTCQTCRDFIIQGYSDDIEDMGQHLEIGDTISSIINGRTIDAHAEKLLDQFKPCHACGTICDTLFPITFTELQFSGVKPALASSLTQEHY